jgi:hypothetical protein
LQGCWVALGPSRGEHGWHARKGCAQSDGRGEPEEPVAGHHG